MMLRLMYDPTASAVGAYVSELEGRVRKLKWAASKLSKYTRVLMEIRKGQGEQWI
jgi:hypothetical protein